VQLPRKHEIRFSPCLFILSVCCEFGVTKAIEDRMNQVIPVLLFLYITGLVLLSLVTKVAKADIG
jgi:hypothetical protein